MRTLRLVPVLVVLLASGCILTSGQFDIPFEFGDFSVTSPTTVTSQQVDLTTRNVYQDHRDKLKAIADLALLGRVTNNGAQPIDVEAWMTPALTAYTTEAQVHASGLRMWGPFHLAAGETKTVGWNESAGLFTVAGKAALLTEVKGDGQFTVYVLGAAGTYNFTVQNGVLVLVIDAGV